MKTNKATVKKDALIAAGDQTATPLTAGGEAQGVQSSSPAATPGTPLNSARRHWEVAGICVLLVGIVFIAFGQTIHFGFVNVDDPEYVYKNPMVLNGISPAGIVWAFTHVVSHHWHPITMMSLMLDCQLFGSWAGGHHLVNVLLHAAGAVLLCLVLLKMTGALWRSAFVAAVFAIHPLRVESVAWISERKDVLSGVFFMLTLWAYASYARRPGSWGRYIVVMVWLALGLMSKPMLVTTPCVLLLLDYWPLKRMQKPSQFPALLWEKIPLFVLSALSSLAAVLALKRGGTDTHSYPANAPVAYVTYLAKLIYPSRLVVIYPLPKEGRELWEVFDSLLLLAAISAGAWLLRRKRPYLLTGWLWFLGMLVPVAGVMQIFNQAYADRYTYLPQIGLCIAATWMAADWAGERRYRRATLGVAAGLILCALLVACWRQTGYWRESETLWTHTIACTQDNFNAHNYLGNALFDEGRTEEAITEWREALEINTNAVTLNNLGRALLKEGRADEAIAQFREALQLIPAYVAPRNNLGVALFNEGHTQEAIDELREALQIDPADLEAEINLGDAMLNQGRLEDAVTHYRAALQINPDLATTHNGLGAALYHLGRTDEAIAEYRKALQMKPAYAEAHYNLALALSQKGQLEQAIGEFREALRIDPSLPMPDKNLAILLRREHSDEATPHTRSQ